jgi:hypothetical protein
MTKNEKPKNKQKDKKVKDGEIPGTVSNQNLGHNAKEEGFSGQHTKR